MELINDVGIFDHFLSDDECCEVIKLFSVKAMVGSDGMDYIVDGITPHTCPTSIMELNDNNTLTINNKECVKCSNCPKMDILLDNFWKNAWPGYSEKYPLLSNRKYDLLLSEIQKTLPGEGYPVEKSERQLSCVDSSRVVTYIIFLNDDFVGGETEFASKEMIITPKKGTLVLFPCNYTHDYKGNPPLSGEKYILTGWVDDIS